MMKVSTVGEMIKLLKLWPEDSALMIDVENIVSEPLGDYEWHEVIVDGPSSSELEVSKKGRQLLVVLRIDSEAIGC